MSIEKTVDSVFRIAKKGELLSFLKNLALSDENVAKKLETRFLKSVKWDYAADIAAAFDKWIEHEYYGCRMHDWDDISSNVKGILSKAVLYVNSGDFVKAADVGLVILETLAEEYDYSEIDEFQYDEDYAIAKGYGTDYDSGRVSFIKEAAEFVVDAITHGKEDGTIQEQKFKELEQRLRKVSITLSQTSFLDGNRDALDCFNSFSKNNMSTNDYCRLQLSIVDKDGDGETAVELYSFLKEHPECDINAETFAEDHLSIESVARAYSLDQEADGNIEKAIAVLQAFFGKDGPNHDHDEMAKKLYEWTMLKGTLPQRESLAKHYFINGADKFRYYSDLKRLVSGERWPELLSELLSAVKSDICGFYTPEWLFDIYAEEDMHEKLKSLILDQTVITSYGRHFGDALNRKIGYLARYAHCLTDEEKASLIGGFTAELYNTASRYDAATYHVLVNSIKTLSRVNAKAKARMEEFATYLRTTFPRRRMLLNILP